MRNLLPRLGTARPALDFSGTATNRWYRHALSAGVLLALAACGGGGGSAGGTSNDGSGTPVRPTGVGDSYLFVSIPDFYFGTRDVGSLAEQEIAISNRGADSYPISNIRIRGTDAEEFSTGVYSDLVLNPAEVVRLQVAFAPITEGRKHADLAIDFETIVQATEAQNQTELRYYDARKLEQRGKYPAAASEYRGYVSEQPVTVNRQRAAVKLPVLRESEVQGDSDAFPQYLAAMNARDEGQYDIALNTVDSLLQSDADSYIADDALYLRGYVELMDLQDYTAALETMRTLRQRYPDSTYYDTALYSEALAQSGLGNDDLARSIFEDLKYRHTGMDTLGITLPKDNMTSRLWFDRANEGLAGLSAA